MVPFPAAWLSSATGLRCVLRLWQQMIILMPHLSYREVCTTLHIPSFSVFSVGHEAKLAETFSYSTAIGLWSTFAEQIPQLRKDVEECPPPNWGQLTEVTKFSWLVSKYCEVAHSSSLNPSASGARPVGDDESSTGDNEAYCDTPRSDGDTLFGSDELNLTDSFDDPALHFMRLYTLNEVSTSCQA